MARNTYKNSAIDAPIAVRIAYLRFPFKAFDVIKMLMGPATGIEKKKPANSPIMEIVKILSSKIKSVY